MFACSCRSVRRELGVRSWQGHDRTRGRVWLWVVKCSCLYTAISMHVGKEPLKEKWVSVEGCAVMACNCVMLYCFCCFCSNSRWCALCWSRQVRENSEKVKEVCVCSLVKKCFAGCCLLMLWLCYAWDVWLRNQVWWATSGRRREERRA